MSRLRAGLLGTPLLRALLLRALLLRALLLVTLLLVALAGCGAVGADPAVPAGPLAVAATSPLPESSPVTLRIGRIDATSTLIPLGLQEDGTVEVPSLDQPMQAGWYRYGPTPGEVGPAVLLGHVNSRGEQGIFARLSELAPGDEVRVERADGRTAVFTVTRVDQVPKTEFPTDAVYGDTADSQLRLITCGGDLDRERRSYRDNIIIYAVLSGVQAG